MAEIIDRQVYLERMAQPLQEKLRVARYLPQHAANVLDVGCADGVVTRALATLFPQTRFLGIDLDSGFIETARREAAQQGAAPNVQFKQIYLRELLARPNRFDAVVFCSVLHEFYTYGEGLSSVLKALADAHELLRPGGVIIIRDMILYEYARNATLPAAPLRARMETVLAPEILRDFTAQYGPLETLDAVNHLLLKYWYLENWERECAEFYVPVTFEQYQQVFRLLGMRLQVLESLTLPFLREKWRTDFGFAIDELDALRSTGILVAQKGSPSS